MNGMRNETRNLRNDEHLMGIVDDREDGRRYSKSRSLALKEAYSYRRFGHVLTGK